MAPTLLVAVETRLHVGGSVGRRETMEEEEEEEMVVVVVEEEEVGEMEEEEEVGMVLRRHPLHPHRQSLTVSLACLVDDFADSRRH
jgi:hypothetical protein